MMKTQKTTPNALDIGALFDDEARNLVKVSRATWRAWKNGTRTPPAAALGLLRLHASGRTLPDAWEGFKFDAIGRLVTPYAETIGPDDILRMFWYMQELRILRGEMRRLTADYDLAPKAAYTAPAIDGEKT